MCGHLRNLFSRTQQFPRHLRAKTPPLITPWNDRCQKNLKKKKVAEEGRSRRWRGFSPLSCLREKKKTQNKTRPPIFRASLIRPVTESITFQDFYGWSSKTTVIPPLPLLFVGLFIFTHIAVDSFFFSPSKDFYPFFLLFFFLADRHIQSRFSRSSRICGSCQTYFPAADQQRRWPSITTLITKSNLRSNKKKKKKKKAGFFYN